ncbi:MAG TPA: MG2 domain-containing protein [Burkholderiales bacterium]|nr:MG2 domain-containing protein [Burkholderiales bacterium]
MKLQLIVCAFGLIAASVQAATVESFSPQGEVKGVRQAAARFSAPMVALGDPRLPAPFEIDCTVPGTARWVDPRNWVYDFERDLPAGVRCSFVLREGVTALDGAPVRAETPFAFSTGGPAILETVPYAGTQIDEEQAFILGLDAPATPATIAEHAYCDAQGVTERIPVRVLRGADRRAVLEARRDFVARFLQSRAVTGRLSQLIAAERGVPLVVLQCQRRLPNNAQMRLVWGRGIASESGVPSAQEQIAAFRVREVFEARFSCERVNKDAHCLPVMPMRLAFTAPVPRASAQQIVLRSAAGGVIRPALPEPAQGGDFINEVGFIGPFAESARFTLELPAELKDDAGRPLSNQRRFPLQVRTDEHPPLARFAARFGIIELKGDGMLPVTLRNLEALVEARSTRIGRQPEPQEAEQGERAERALDWMRRQLESSRGEDGRPVPGVVSRVADGDVAAIIRWMRRLRDAETDRWRFDEAKQQNVREYRAGERSIFNDQDRAQRMLVPKPQGARAFEVVGIPLRQPGFYVVELASPRLGASLLGERNRPFYVQSSALVTNLAVHFKWGRESSLVWVTALDTGQPVGKAQIAVQDCAGRVHFRGETDGLGRARIGAVLPERERVPPCLANGDRQLVASARVGDDLGLVFSDWNEGIAGWRFNLRGPNRLGPHIATTVFDRTLLRAGETVSMKHFYRQHGVDGFAYVPVGQLPPVAVVRHLGSDDAYEMPLRWDGRSISESAWQIPAGAKTGTYQVTMTDSLGSRPGQTRQTRVTGTFRVEDFRVPLMKAEVAGPQAPQVRAESVALDLHLRYLSGGGAGGAPVRVRGMVRPKSVSFADYQGFSFANGRVEEGIERDAAHLWHSEEYELVDEAGDDAAPVQVPRGGARPIRTVLLDLDQAGSARVPVSGLPLSDLPQDLVAEMEYSDPNGEMLTTSTRVALWPSSLILGVKPDAWAASQDQLSLQVVVLDLSGKPLKDRRVKVELFQRQPFAHRKRLVGGFYGYESGAEIRKLPAVCEGASDARGLVHCTVKPEASGNILMLAHALDAEGRVAWAHASAWVAGQDDWWFDASDDDRIDVIPERKRYELGQTAQIQVRMPFRRATALVTVEREGVIDSFVYPLSGTAPVIRLPIKPTYAPNAFVSVMVVRGRTDDVKPTAMIDLGKPAFKMGVTEIEVGWRVHELNVQLRPERETYKVRDKARVALQVTQRQGGKPVRGTEVAVAVVDEGLLELLPNDSWQLLPTMMRLRGIEVDTATASMQVVGKRHYGRKALPQGGGGGRETTRELFDTLLYWKGRVQLDARGAGTIEFPLNDSLTSFRVVAIADAGTGLFGTGQATIRTTQDLQLMSGLPQLIREGDRFEARFTVRNASQREMQVEIGGKAGAAALPVSRIALGAGQASEIAWQLTAPAGRGQLAWEVTASEATAGGLVLGDRLRVSQSVTESVPVRTLQSTIAQLEVPLALPVSPPEGALAGRGSIRVSVKPRLGEELAGVREYMRRYDYTCLEQRASRAVSLQEESAWQRVMDDLPSYLDRDGLVKYFPSERRGSDTLTAYLLSIAQAADLPLRAEAQSRMLAGLRAFVEGRVLRDSPLPNADLSVRKIAALAALSQYVPVEPAMLSSIAIEPNLWPTSAVIDWHGLLKRVEMPERERQLAQAEQLLRARLNFQGTVMGFSTERTDYLWWLMVSGDVNANRLLLAFMEDEKWRADIPRLVRGALARQQAGRWNTTVANAWGTVAMRKFSDLFESEPVAGQTAATLGYERTLMEWTQNPRGADLDLPWPLTTSELELSHSGPGRPWVTVSSRAAVPLSEPLNAGFRVSKSVLPVEVRESGQLHRGDTVRVRLEIEAQADMSWVVLADPVPAGATILGRGLGGESQILAAGEQGRAYVWPTFEERTFEAFRAYYRFVPKGSWTVEYTMRLNNAGRFQLPPTRVEAMYAPEMFGELPNATFGVLR